jgi:hypothetical protein
MKASTAALLHVPLPCIATEMKSETFTHWISNKNETFYRATVIEYEFRECKL